LPRVLFELASNFQISLFSVNRAAKKLIHHKYLTNSLPHGQTHSVISGAYERYASYAPGNINCTMPLLLKRFTIQRLKNGIANA
jgi:hypothetical protein